MQQEQPKLRPITAADVPFVLTLRKAFCEEDGHHYDLESSKRALTQVVTGEALGRIWLIEIDGKDIGYVCVTLGFSLEVAAGDFYLDEIYVTPDVRGQGVGRAAIELAEHESRALGARRLVLEVELSNPRARKLYESIGFQLHERALMSKPL